MKIIEKKFGKLWNNTINLFEISNENNVTVSISDYGGIITNLCVPDKDGNIADIVLGFDNLYDYLKGHPFFGAIAGRFANRIRKGKFSLNDKNYQLNTQAEGHHLHGGVRGFDKYIWQAETKVSDNKAQLTLSHTSPDGDENYPGALTVKAVYSLNQDNELNLTFYATSDEDTIINLVNHSYFNLAGHNSGSVEGHNISVKGKQIVEVDEELIPTGNLKDIIGSSLDCYELTNMGKMFSAQKGGVVDYCYVLDNLDKELKLVSEVVEPISGRVMKLFSDNVGVQFYNGVKLGQQKMIGKDKVLYGKFSGFCLETQCYPDSPNHDNFPSCVLKKGDIYSHTWRLKFSTI